MTRTLSIQPDTFSDLPVSDIKTRRLGFTILLITFGIFGVWAGFAPIDGAVYAPGIVTVQAYRKTVQHLEGGIVKDVLVHDGDIVRMGDPLILLDDAQLRAEYDMNHNQLIAAKAMEARLLAERDNLPSIDFGSLSEADTLRGTEARTGEKQVFNARRGARLGQISVLQERIGQLNQQIKGTEDMIGTKANLESSYTAEITDLRDLLAQGFVDKQRMLEQQRKLDMLKSEVADHRSTITKTRLQINKLSCRFCRSTKTSAPTLPSNWLKFKPKLMTSRKRLRRWRIG